MAIGPVQLIVLGFADPDFHGQIAGELDKLRASDTVRVIDALVVYKDAQGEVEVRHASNLTTEESVEFGSKVGALLGLGVGGEEGMEVGAAAGAEAGAEGTQFFSDDEAWDVVAELPENTAVR
jgi:Predicted membrane protein